VEPTIEELTADFLSRTRLYSREEALASPSPVAVAGGVYGWWFNVPPAVMDTSGCHERDGYRLLYIGISPTRPPMNGRPPSKSGLRRRIQTHCAGNAEGSTLRKTLGCLLSEELGIELRRVGSGNRRTFVRGEQALSAWIEEHARVGFVLHHRPWELEDHLIASVDLPLNLQGNSRNRFHSEVSAARSRCVARANAALQT
jgi:hypothetical protein